MSMATKNQKNDSHDSHDPMADQKPKETHSSKKESHSLGADEMDEPRVWRICHGDQEVDLMLSVHHEIGGQPQELQKLLYASWIKRTNSYFKGKQESDIPIEIQSCLAKAKSSIEE